MAAAIITNDNGTPNDVTDDTILQRDGNNIAGVQVGQEVTDGEDEKDGHDEH